MRPAPSRRLGALFTMLAAAHCDRPSTPGPQPAAAARPGSPPTATSVPATCPPETVRIAAGSFAMGDAHPDAPGPDAPVHQVTLHAFCIDRTEVTVARYDECIAAHRCAAPAAITDPRGGNDPAAIASANAECNAGHPERAQHPINCVTWDEAAAFCAWAHARLPTEAEWEFAARGRDGRRYPWGIAPPDATRLNAAGSERPLTDLLRRTIQHPVYTTDDGFAATAPVAHFPLGATPEGVLDLAGNVSEWVADRFSDLSTDAATDPVGPSHGAFRVFRGGSYFTAEAGDVVAAHRGMIEPDSRDPTLGFRCAR
jgi:formylglycine-generating enzyme required for sulfatase activity